MRLPLDRTRIEKLMAALGSAVPGEGRVYFTGGVSALLFGWRDSTIDADLSAAPEPAGLFQAIARVKQELDMNLELASPADFMPALSGWEGRSRFIARHGRLDFYHYDFYSQALAKILRFYERDQRDVQGMFEDKLIQPQRLQELFVEAKPRMVRYPKLDPERFEERLRIVLQSLDAAL